MKWDKKDQSIWDCFHSGLIALKRHDWLTLQEYEHVCDFIHRALHDKEMKK